MRIMETKVYKFVELSDEAKGRAIGGHRESACDDTFWSECVIDDAKEIAGLMGIEIDKIYYSGFSSQGDGACFEGVYSYKSGMLKAVITHAPGDKNLHAIARALSSLQRANGYLLEAKVKHSGHYYHNLCTIIDASKETVDSCEILIRTENALTEILRDYMQWIYNRLEEEYYYQISDKVVIENIEANEHEFTANGKLV